MKKVKGYSGLSGYRYLFGLVVILLFAQANHAVVSNAKGAIDEASRTGQFLLLTFYEAKDAALTSLSTNIADFRKTAVKKTVTYEAKTGDAKEKDIVDKYGVAKAKLPVLLVIAPNGAVTGGFQQTASADQLKQCLEVSNLNLKILKPLQEQKVVLLAFQNKATKFNQESLKAVTDFAADQQFKQFVGTLQADPVAQESQEFLKQIGQTEAITEATVVILLPPNSVGKILKGNITKADILSSLQSCSAGSGCCPGPKK